MAEIVNLRQARKRKQRAQEAERAERNRVAHGRTKEEKALTRARNEKTARDHEAGHLEGSPQEPGTARDPSPRSRR